MREIIEITSEAQWLELRKQDITSTAMAGLLDMSPYSTPFEVYHAHKSGVQVPFDPTERMEKGKRMEAYVANEIGIKNGWKIRPINEYIRIPELRMAASFDFEYEKPDGTLGILEVKGVDYWQFKEKWESPDEDGEATPYVEIQLQHQLECADCYEEGVIVAATSIYDFHEYHRQRDHEFGQNLRTTVKKFWDDVAAGNAPDPNYYRDGPVFDELFKNISSEPIDMTKDNELNVLASKYERLQQEEAEAKKEKDATKVKIFEKLEEAGGAFTAGFKINATRTKDSAPTVITQDMVGTTIGGRKGYRQCRITNLNKD